MKRFISALLFSALLPMAAFAADMPVKVPVATNVYDTSGWFLDVGTSAGVAQSSVTGSNLFATSLVNGGLTAAGAGVKVGFGYIGYGGPTGSWWMATNDFTYQNITGANGVGGSLQSTWMVTQEACFGVELFSYLSGILPNIGATFPTFSNLTPPPGATGTPRQCFSVASREFEVNGRLGTAAGQTVGWEPGVGTHFIWEAVNPTTSKPTGGAWDVSALVSFPTRGVTFSNVAATNGAPIAVGAGASLGTQYEVSLTYHFRPGGSLFGFK